ncbi:MAG TPA: CHAT domain-containing protein [Pyrinomonadaceae bacterium]|nr:CHAT domain-containing protein [Pyrinomonadaceae bacterium]
MAQKTRILFLSANPWTTSRILVDEEAREISEKLQQGSYRDKFELLKHAATRVIDLQRLLLMHRPHIVHFSAHGSKRHKIILGGSRGRGKEVDPAGLVELFALYRSHVKLVFLNACFTRTQAQSLCQVIDYSVGTGKMIGDKGGVAFAGAFYRSLGFGKSVSEAFQSAKAELAVLKIPRSSGLELFKRPDLRSGDSFPKTRARGKRRHSERQTTSRTSSEDRCITGRRGELLRDDPIFLPSTSLVGALRQTRASDGSHSGERRIEVVNSVRTEVIVSRRSSKASLQERPLPASKTKRRLGEARRDAARRRGKERSSVSLLPASATATVHLLRVVRTESFDLVVNNLAKE